MSRRGKLIFVCSLFSAACALFQMQHGRPALAAPANATLQSGTAVRQLDTDGDYASMTAPRDQSNAAPANSAAPFDADHPEQRLRAGFAPDPVGVIAASKTAGAQLRLQLAGYGYGEQLDPSTNSEITANIDRITIRKSAIQAWSRAWSMGKPEGSEQGFALAPPPAGKQPSFNVAALTGDMRFRAGLRNSPSKDQLDAGQLNQVLLSLREKTGWLSLKFDESGFLVCPDRHVFSGGSEAARRLLGEAIFSDKAFYLETHNRSMEVVFARLAPGIDYEHHLTGAKIRSQTVQIDFADFNQRRGHRPALKAFDLGLVILHELAHGVWHLRDAEPGEAEPGECETFINRIRRELHLPERQNYHAHMRHCGPNCTGLIAELRFTPTLERQGQGNRKHFLLQWEAKMVGTITNFNLANSSTPGDARKQTAVLFDSRRPPPRQSQSGLTDHGRSS